MFKVIHHKNKKCFQCVFCLMKVLIFRKAINNQISRIILVRVFTLVFGLLASYWAMGQEVSFLNITETDNILSNAYGLSVVDLDNDGYEDMYVMIKNQANKFYHNNGDGTFTNIAVQLGIADAGNTNAAVWADFDNDGDKDLYVGNWGQPNKFYLNLGDAGFIEIGATLGVNNSGNCRSLAVADVNRDGWLDIYVVNISQENAFYLSNGSGGYINHYNASMATDNLIGMGSIFFDCDNDGDPDLYLLHDAYQANKLFINNGNGVFTNQAVQRNAAYQGEGMGVDVTDFNHDGWLDIYITNNYDGNALLVNDGDGTFTSIGVAAGVNNIGMGWGVSWFDYNLDGEQDLYMANNYVFSPLINVLYHNNGDSTFTQVGQGSALDSPYAGAGIAISDFNLDGREDIAIANPISATSPGVEVLLNQSDAGNWLAFTFEGVLSNRDAFGTRVTVWSEGFVQTDEWTGPSGYSQQNSSRMTFGLGERQVADSVQIRWPNGLEETYANLSANERYHFIEGNSAIGNGDVNQDLAGNVQDLLLFLANFGCTGDCTADINNDGIVNSQDLLLVLMGVFPD